MKKILTLLPIMLFAFFAMTQNASAAPPYEYEYTMNGPGHDASNSVVIDTVGNIYITGSFEQTVNFDPTGGTDNHTSSGGSDIFLTKINADGSYGYTKTMGGAIGDSASDITIDTNNNIYITGSFAGTADFDPTTATDSHTSNGLIDIFLTKINANGTYGYTYTMGGTLNDYAKGLTTDTVGNIFLTGGFGSPIVDFDPTAGTDNHTHSAHNYRGHPDIFLTKINADATYGYTYTMGGTMRDQGNDITTDTVGNIYFTGHFGGGVNFNTTGSGPADNHLSGGDGGNAVSGRVDIFFTKINADGSYGYTYTMGGDDNESGYDIATDIAGNIYITGNFGDTMDFDPTTGTDIHVAQYNRSAIFLTKINADKSYGYTRTMVNNLDDDGGHGVTIDTAGNSYITGFFRNTIDFDPTSATDNRTSHGADDIFLTRTNADGSYGYTCTMGTVSGDGGNGVITDTAGNIYLTGSSHYNKTRDYATEDYIYSNGGIFLKKLTGGVPCDLIPPVITLTGTTPTTVEVNTSYIDEGATCTDNYDPTCNVTTGGSDIIDTTTVGTHTVTYNAVDNAGNHATAVTRTVNVVDTTAPVITQVTPVPDPTNDPTPTYTFHTDEAGTITYGGSCSSTTTAATVGDNTITFNPLTDGTYNDCTLTVTDSAGHVSNTLALPPFTVDATAPVITLTGSTPINILLNNPYIDAGATCTDNHDPICTVTIGGDTVDTTTVGTYTITYNATDSRGNHAIQVTRTVHVITGNRPVITLTGNDPETVEVHTTYTDAGATAFDTEDGDLTGSIVTVNPVDITVVSTYIVTYNVIDASGNNADEVTRTVNVVDTTAPVITQVTPVPDPTDNPTPDYTFHTDEAGTITYGGSCSSTTTAATVGDNTITLNPFTDGTYSDCTLTVTDSAGHVSNILAIPSFTVDTTAPVITLTGTTPVDVLLNDTYTDAGATCTDNYDPTCTVTTGGSDIIDTTTVGTHTVTYNAVDNTGNHATAVTRIVNVTAGNLPVITLTGNNPETVEVNTTYTDAGATAFDTEDGDLTGSIVTVNPVDITVVSTYIVTYNVIDASGNNADEVIRIVNVIDTTAPVITQVTPVPDPTNNPTYTFHTDKAGTITYGGSCSSTTTAATVGDNTITFGTLTDGTYNDCTITVTDAAGNVSNTLSLPSFTVDTVPPVVTLTGPDPLNILHNDPYTEQGATCTDNLDPTCAVTIGGDTVDTTTVGPYTVTYDAVDATGNHATQVTRTVNVTVSQPPQVSTKPVYRFWSNIYRAHFYTASEQEKDAMTKKYAQDMWRLEGIAYISVDENAPNATPVYRFWSEEYKNHFYTTSAPEKDKVIANYPEHVWRYEGITYYVQDISAPTSKSIYRFWSEEYKGHFYASTEYEKDLVIKKYPEHIWKYEGLAWYAAG